MGHHCPGSCLQNILDVSPVIGRRFIGGNGRARRLEIKFCPCLNILEGQCWVMVPCVWPNWVHGRTGVSREARSSLEKGNSMTEGELRP